MPDGSSNSAPRMEIPEPRTIIMPQHSKPSDTTPETESATVFDNLDNPKTIGPSPFEIPSEYLDAHGYIKPEFFDQLPEAKDKKDLTVEEVNAMDDLYYAPWKYGPVGTSNTANGTKVPELSDLSALRMDFESFQAGLHASEALRLLTEEWLRESQKETKIRKSPTTAQNNETK